MIRTNTSPNTNTGPISRIAKEVGISVGRTHQGQAGNGQKKAAKKSMGVRENSYSLLELNPSLLNRVNRGVYRTINLNFFFSEDIVPQKNHKKCI